MTVCVISFKECWRDGHGGWLSTGGFPVQMAAIASLFDAMTLVIVEVAPRQGGMPLPAATVIPLREPRGRDLRRKLHVVRHLPSYLRTFREAMRTADAVHTPVPGDMPFLAMLCAVVMRKRLLARYGSSWPATAQTTLMNRVTKWCMRRLAGGRNVMVATGAGEAPPARHMHWLFATALSAHEVASARPDLHRAAGRPLRLVYLGRLSEEKGVTVLIEALSMLRRQRPALATDLTLQVVGDGPARAALEAQLATAGCGDFVTFAGQQARPAALACVADADVCVLPSLTESFCKARLDAMLCGTPVLTTDVGFGREIVGATGLGRGLRGWVVPPGSPEALRDVLGELLDTPLDWPALRRRCHEYVQRHTLEHWTERIGALCAEHWQLRVEGGKLR